MSKCEECHNCFLSCKDEHVDNDFLPYSAAQPRHGHRWLNITTKERGQFPLVDVVSLPVLCMQCDNAPCIKNAKNGAVYKLENGIVVIDPVKAKGQREIVKSCPYGAIWWNEEKQVAQKCTMCAHLLADGWKEPRCVQSCPTGAMRFVSAEDSQMAETIKSEKLEVFHPEYKTMPRVYYKNLYRYMKCFIAGSVAFQKDGITDCADGANVALYKQSEKVGETTANNYGDFKFDDLPENSGDYRLEINFGKFPKKTLAVHLTTSQSVGTILL
ncbi:MAG TPA: 4Fe-4S dicluster domain-containing protein [Dehalococcoidales bacterium]|nr:4Fe-4S dicluster domain-containing protein [Dehalococcoidales bacterium]